MMPTAVFFTIWICLAWLGCFSSATLLLDVAALDGLLHEASSYRDDLVTHYRHLHANPELSFQEFETSAYIRQQLDLMNITYKHPFATTGISATIGAGPPTFALRADMDALPIQEAVEVPWKSTKPGVMHACGHDAHVTMLLGAARLLKARESSLRGTVVLIFQPAEEGGGGASFVVQEGGLQGAQAISALHVGPMVPSGTLASRVGTIMASSDRFTFNVTGRGGHAGMPDTTADPVVAASAVVLALQTIVSRETSPTDAAVVSVASFNSGTPTFNVIPDSVELRGTVRALSQPTFDRVRRRVEEIASSIASAYGCLVDSVQWSPVPYGPTVNEQSMVQLLQDVTSGLAHAASSSTDGSFAAGLPVPKFLPIPQSLMTAEDFCFYGQQVPAVFSFIGTGNSDLGTQHALHNPRFKMDESVLPLGAAINTALALEYLARHQEPAAGTAHEEL